MKTFSCACGNTLFFDSSSCLKCSAVVGICPTCQNVEAVRLPGSQKFQCENPACGASLTPCANNESHAVCNSYLSTDNADEQLCIYCRLNDLIPDLSIDGNLAKWCKLETAKRRVLYGVLRLGLPVSSVTASTNPCLSFAFKADDEEPVATGHANGRITINLREADDVERERTRVAFGEPQRTLVGHFRHELGHYYWELIVKPQRLSEFRNVFGHEGRPAYPEAQKAYYAEGPRVGWQDDFISAYASMHPWEDFAETFAAYLDIAAVLETTAHFGLTRHDGSQLNAMLDAFRKIGTIANELNRDMGLPDLVPEILTPRIIEKLKFIHSLRK